MKKKFICTVCGYIYEGTEAPEKCPICKAPASKFKEMEDAVDDDMTFAGWSLADRALLRCFCTFINVTANGANKLFLHNVSVLNVVV